MAKIDGLVLPVNLSGSLGGPANDAAKVFLEAASKGMAQVVKNALISAVGEAVGGGAPPAWVAMIKGCQLDLNWETVPGSAPRTVVAFAAPDSASVGGVDVGISVTAHF